MTEPGQPCVIDQRQCVLMRRPDVDEVNLHPVDLSHELRQCVQSCLALAPVVLSRPIAGERSQRRQLHALRPIFDELLGGPARGHEAPAEISEVSARGIDAEGKNCVGSGSTHRGAFLLRFLTGAHIGCGDEMHRKKADGTGRG
jgi:hypothetical protein